MRIEMLDALLTGGCPWKLVKSRGASGGSEEEDEDEDDEEIGDRSDTPTLVLRALTPEKSSDGAASSSRAASRRGLRVIGKC